MKNNCLIFIFVLFISFILCSEKEKYSLIPEKADFGFGFKTGILLPDEQSGVLRHFEDWSYQSNKSLSINGQ